MEYIALLQALIVLLQQQLADLQIQLQAKLAQESQVVVEMPIAGSTLESVATTTIPFIYSEKELQKQELHLQKRLTLEEIASLPPEIRGMNSLAQYDWYMNTLEELLR